MRGAGKMSWVKKSGYRAKSGKWVNDYWAFYELRDASRKSSHRHKCPACHASILSVRMPRGGWAHFECGKGLGSVKHPCFNLGEHLSRKRGDEMNDLFEA